jgi:hypothetical protein
MPLPCPIALQAHPLLLDRWPVASDVHRSLRREVLSALRNEGHALALDEDAIRGDFMGGDLRVPSRAVMVDARDGDTLRIELTVEDAVASDVRRDRRGTPAAPRARPWFVQMKGTAAISGRIGGVPIDGRGTGFFETYR